MSDREVQRRTKLHPDLFAAAEAAPVEGSAEATARTPIAAVASGSPSDLERDLAALGMTDAATEGLAVTGVMPTQNIARVSELSTLRYMSPQWMTTLAGSVDSQGDRAMRSDILREGQKLSGEGITVAVISDSFDCLGGAPADVASGDLPPGVIIVKEGACEFGLGDEGRAMAQIVTDVAPDARIMFRRGFVSHVDTAQGIAELVDAGADVIVDDIFYGNEPWFQEGPIPRAIEAAAEAGVVYVTAAGNFANVSYEGAFNDSGVEGEAAGSTLHDFARSSAVDTKQRITVPPLSATQIVMQWSDNFAIFAPDGPAVRTDLDILARTRDGVVSRGGNDDNRLTLQPVEFITIPNATTRPLKVDLEISRFAGPSPQYVKWVAMSEDVTIDEFRTNGGTIVGHHQAARAISVGAATFKDTPAFGQSPPLRAPYSAFGATPIIRDVNGDLLSRPYRPQKPDVIAPSGANTTFFIFDTPDDEDLFPNFSGTSAAAPHAAGVAALLLEQQPKASSLDVCNALVSTAVEMDKDGFDFGTGHGLVAADAAATWLSKPERTGPCGKRLPVQIRAPEPEPEPTLAPSEPPAAPTVTAPPPTPPPPPTPTPIPDRPHVFVEQRDVIAGGFVQVSGWYLSRNATYTIALENGRQLGSARSYHDGRMFATVQVPADVQPGQYAVTVSGPGIGTMRAARRITVHAQAVAVAGISVTPSPGEPAGWLDARTLLFLVLAFAGTVAAIVVARRSRWT